MFVSCSVVLVMSVTTGLSEKCGIKQWHSGLSQDACVHLDIVIGLFHNGTSGLSQDACLHSDVVTGVFHNGTRGCPKMLGCSYTAPEDYSNDELGEGSLFFVSSQVLSITAEHGALRRRFVFCAI